MSKETATLAAGCFWCIEAAMDQLEGVESVEILEQVGHDLAMRPRGRCVNFPDARNDPDCMQAYFRIPNRLASGRSIGLRSPPSFTKAFRRIP